MILAKLSSYIGACSNLAIMEREARSQRELQALQAANNKAAKHQESVLVKLCVLVKLRGRAPRPRSASWRGVAWNASRAGGLNGSLQRKILSNMPPKCHPGGSKIAPKSLENCSRRPPGAPPRAETKVVTFVASFFCLLSGSWGAPGTQASGPSRGAPGGHCGLPGVSFWSLLGLFLKTP